MNKGFRELVGYKIMPVNSHTRCQAPQDACEECTLCCIHHRHYEKIGPDGLCDSERAALSASQHAQSRRRRRLRLWKAAVIIQFSFPVILVAWLPPYIGLLPASIIATVIYVWAFVFSLLFLLKISRQ